MNRMPILLLIIALCSCRSEMPASSSAPAPAAPQFQEVADVKQLMNWIMEPSADLVWESVGTIITEAGEQNLRPETDEQWTAIRNAAAVVAESGNLLLTPARLRDRDEWMKQAHELTKTAQQVIAAAEAKDADALFTAGGDMYLVCTACHSQYALGLKKVD